MSDDDGLWNATVGGTDFDGLGASDIGKLLWRGRKVSVTILGDDGIPQRIQVCEEFPEIALESSESGFSPGPGSATVRIDLANCMVTLAELTHTTTGTGSGTVVPNPAPHSLIWTGSMESVGVPISWNSFLMHPSAASSSPRARQTIRQSYLYASLVAADGIGFALTQARVFSQHEVGTLNSLGHNYHCVTKSPGFWARVAWLRDRCTGGQTSGSQAVRTWARGSFHAISVGNVRFSRDTNHTISATQMDTPTSVRRICQINPRSITNLRAVYAGISLGVSFKCQYNTVIRY